MFQFTSTCPAVTTMLILTFAITLTITLGQEDTESAFQYLGPGYTYKYIEPSPTENFYPSQNVMECAMKSLYSGSRFFSYHKVSRLCKNYSARRKLTMSTTQDSNEISFYRVEDWMKVYAISRGTGSDVRNSFLGYGTPSSWNVDKCKDNICPNFFRHPLLDTWDSLQIDEVKLVLYKNQTPVLNMVFNGRNTTRKNWFSFENLKSSPWNDLNQGMAEVFSINGNQYANFITLCYLIVFLYVL
ncbi:uncharacterized protein LOC106873528 [Octopus bimaculoides]|nr:uncharacterized protein LOC106873528 [Octopus bimaculoides]